VLNGTLTLFSSSPLKEIEKKAQCGFADGDREENSMSTSVAPTIPAAGSAPAAAPAATPRWQVDRRIITGIMIVLAAIGGYLTGREVERQNRYDTYWLLGATFAQDLEGVYIDYLHPGGPTEMAGLQEGDRIGAIDGKPVTKAAEARRIIAERDPGDTVQITIRRGTFTAQYPVVLGFLIVVNPDPVVVQPIWPTNVPPPVRGQAQEGRLGVYYRMIEPGDPFSVNNGAVLVTVWPGGAAEAAHLETGDIILEVGGINLSSSMSLSEALDQFNSGDVVELSVLQTDGNKITVRVKL
jgi:S1-C subfamily serine protease